MHSDECHFLQGHGEPGYREMRQRSSTPHAPCRIGLVRLTLIILTMPVKTQLAWSLSFPPPEDTLYS